MGRLADAVRSYWLGPWSSGDPALSRYYSSGQPTAAGVAVSEYTALNLSAVWAAVNCIASGVAALPLSFFKRVGEEDKERFFDHPNYRLLHDAPNPEMTSFTFRETLGAHALTWGGGYAEIQRDQAERPVALWPMTPDRVDPYRENGTGRLKYRVHTDKGTQAELDADNVLHIPGPGFDGVRGYSVIWKARESLGLTSATEQFGATYFGNGSVSSGSLEHPGHLSPDARTNLEKSIESRHQGTGKAHRLMILEEGMKFSKTSIPPNDAQFLETRKFQIVEIARWFNVPPHKLRDLERATFSNIEHQSVEFVTDSLMPWLVRWEQELNRKLIRPLERRQQFFKHNVNALMRGDTAARKEFYATGRQWGYFSANDVLRFEDENGIGPDGDVYLIPQNMIPANRIDEVIDKQVAPTPTPQAPTSTAEPALNPDATPARTLRIVETIKEIIEHQEPPALPPAPEPDPRLDEVLAAVRALPPPPDGGYLVQDPEEFTARLTGALRDVSTITAEQIASRLATDQTLRAWQSATIAMLAGRFVRREIAEAKKIAADPERADEKLTVFYLRFVDDFARDCQPFAAVTGVDVRPRLTQWATEAREECIAAVTAGTMESLLMRWIERHDALTRALLEVIHGDR